MFTYQACFNGGKLSEKVKNFNLEGSVTLREIQTRVKKGALDPQTFILESENLSDLMKSSSEFYMKFQHSIDDVDFLVIYFYESQCNISFDREFISFIENIGATLSIT